MTLLMPIAPDRLERELYREAGDVLQDGKEDVVARHVRSLFEELADKRIV